MEYLILLPLLIVMLFLPTWMTKRARDKQLAGLKSLRESLSQGDRVITAGGIYGTVAGLSETTVDLEVAVGTVVTFDKEAIIRRPDTVVSDAQPTDDPTSAAS